MKLALVEIAKVIQQQKSNDIGVMASYAQKETSELAEACLIFKGKIKHKKPASKEDIIDELADSIQSAFVLAAVTLDISPAHLANLTRDHLIKKNKVWTAILEAEDYSNHDAKLDMDEVWEKQCELRLAGKAFVKDRADGAKGSYTVARMKTENCIEYWNEKANKFTAFGTVFVSISMALTISQMFNTPYQDQVDNT